MPLENPQPTGQDVLNAMSKQEGIDWQRLRGMIGPLDASGSWRQRRVDIASIDAPLRELAQQYAARRESIQKTGVTQRSQLAADPSTAPTVTMPPPPSQNDEPPPPPSAAPANVHSPVAIAPASSVSTAIPFSVSDGGRQVINIEASKRIMNQLKKEFADLSNLSVINTLVDHELLLNKDIADDLHRFLRSILQIRRELEKGIPKQERVFSPMPMPSPSRPMAHPSVPPPSFITIYQPIPYSEYVVRTDKAIADMYAYFDAKRIDIRPHSPIVIRSPSQPLQRYPYEVE